MLESPQYSHRSPARCVTRRRNERDTGIGSLPCLQLRAEFEDGQGRRDAGEAFGFAFLSGGQFASAVLLIEQELEPLVQCFREPQFRQLCGHGNGELDGSVHRGDHSREVLKCKRRGLEGDGG